MSDVEAILLPYQQAWVADKSQVRVWEKSRRIGASWCMASESVLDAARTGGQDTFYIGYSKEMAQEFINDCAFWAVGLQLAASATRETLVDNEFGEKVIEDERTGILSYEIRLASGHRVKALSSRPTNLRSRSGHAVLDEAAFHDDLEGLLKAALAFLLWNGRVSILSTHFGVESTFNKIITDIKAGKSNFSLHRTTFDDAVEQGLFRRICLMRGQDWTQELEDGWIKEIVSHYKEDADEELHCIPSKSGGAYLSVGLIEECMYDAPILRLEYDDTFTWKSQHIRRADAEEWCARVLLPLILVLSTSRIHALGEDFGRTSDLTVLAPITVEQNLDRRVPFLVELRKVPFQQQEQIAFFLLDRLPRLVKACFDATGNGQQLAESAAQRYGQDVVEQLHLTEKAYGEILPPFKAAFEDHAIWIPRDSDVRDDLRAFTVINGIPKLPKTKTSKKKQPPRHGDAAIALALGYHATTMEYQAYDYRSARPGSDNAHHETSTRPIKNTAGFGAHKGIW